MTLTVKARSGSKVYYSGHPLRCTLDRYGDTNGILRVSGGVTFSASERADVYIDIDASAFGYHYYDMLPTFTDVQGGSDDGATVGFCGNNKMSIEPVGDPQTGLHCSSHVDSGSNTLVFGDLVIGMRTWGS